MSEPYQFDPALRLAIPTAAILPEAVVAAASNFDPTLKRTALGHPLTLFILAHPAMQAMQRSRIAGDTQGYEEARHGLMRVAKAATIIDLLSVADDMYALRGAGYELKSGLYQAASRRGLAAVSGLLAMDWLSRALRPQ